VSADLFGFDAPPLPRTNDRPEAAARQARSRRPGRSAQSPAASPRRRLGGTSEFWGGEDWRPVCSVRVGWLFGPARDDAGWPPAGRGVQGAGREGASRASRVSLSGAPVRWRRRFGGVAFVARDCRDVLRELPVIGEGSTLRRDAPATLGDDAKTGAGKSVDVPC